MKYSFSATIKKQPEIRKKSPMKNPAYTEKKCHIQGKYSEGLLDDPIFKNGVGSEINSVIPENTSSA